MSSEALLPSTVPKGAGYRTRLSLGAEVEAGSDFTSAPLLEGSGGCYKPVEVIRGCWRSSLTRRKAHPLPRFISPTLDPPSEFSQGREEVIVPGSKDQIIL